MKENFADKVTNKLKEQLQFAITKAREEFKNTNPYRKAKLTDSELLDYYQQMTPDEMTGLVEQYGEESVNNFISRMEMMRYGKR